MQLTNGRKGRKFFFGKTPRASSKSETFVLDNTYYEEISNLTEAGGWSVDFVKKASFFDQQARSILEVPDDYVPSLRNGYSFYAEEHRDLAATLFFNCAQGKPFREEIKMVTYKNKVFWAKAHGRPLYNNQKEIVGVRGAFQDITQEKEKEIRLQQSLEIIEGHNKRLYDFAQIVSHNLCSQVTNLQLSATLFGTENLTKDQLELHSSFEEIARSLNTTLNHLNEIVSLQNPSNLTMTTVTFSNAMQKVQTSMQELINQSRSTIYTDFSEVEEIEYVASYLDSILRNLIHNAIQFKHPDRDPEINIYTYQENDKSFLSIKDNGLGIDLDRYGEKVFKMYSTFHNNGAGQGIGLFLVKNQVEALGGNITVESKIEKFTKFTIQLSS